MNITYYSIPFEWHDARFIGFYVTQENDIEFNVVIDLDAFPSNKAPERETYSVTFFDVRKLALMTDFLDMRDNANAGNISDAFLREEEGFALMRMYLVDGYIEIIAVNIQSNKRDKNKRDTHSKTGRKPGTNHGFP
jgi:hypothetical protein